jgi:hypothetical protein
MKRRGKAFYGPPANGSTARVVPYVQKYLAGMIVLDHFLRMYTVKGEIRQ